MEDMMQQGKSLYELAIAVDPDDALRMAMEAKDTEEKRFFTFIADMNLQRRDREEFRERLAKKEKIKLDRPGLKELTFTEVLQLKEQEVIISHIEKGVWEDKVRPVASFMDMNHLPLASGSYLDLDDFGTGWIVYQKEN